MEMKSVLIAGVVEAHEAVIDVANMARTLPADTGTLEQWSAKDLIVHIAVWKARLALALAASLRGEPPASYGDMDTENTAIFHQYRDLPWKAIMHMLESAHADLVERTLAVREKDLADVDQYAWYGQPLWKGIIMNSYWHPMLHLA